MPSARRSLKVRSWRPVAAAAAVATACQGPSLSMVPRGLVARPLCIANQRSNMVAGRARVDNTGDVAAPPLDGQQFVSQETVATVSPPGTTQVATFAMG